MHAGCMPDFERRCAVAASAVALCVGARMAWMLGQLYDGGSSSAGSAAARGGEAAGEKCE